MSEDTQKGGIIFGCACSFPQVIMSDNTDSLINCVSLNDRGKAAYLLMDEFQNELKGSLLYSFDKFNDKYG